MQLSRLSLVITGRGASVQSDPPTDTSVNEMALFVIADAPDHTTRVHEMTLFVIAEAP